MTSSQALTLNLFGPLNEDRAWAAAVFSKALGRSDIHSVHDIWIEYAPRRRSQYLNDMTRVDALVLLGTLKGAELLVVETKYADRLNSRSVDIDREPYQDLAARTAIWRDPAKVLNTAEDNQLARCHALAAAVSPSLADTDLNPELLVLYHQDDVVMLSSVERYSRSLRDPSLAHAMSLRDFISILRGAAPSETRHEPLRALELRYAGEEASQEMWEFALQSPLR